MSRTEFENKKYNLIAFLILFYPFNITITFTGISKLIFQDIFSLLGISLLIFDYLFKIKKGYKIHNLELFMLLIIFVFGLFMYARDLKHIFTLKILYWSLCSLLPLLLCQNKKMLRAFINVLPIFFIEHIVGVLFELLFPNLYFTVVIKGMFANVPGIVYNRIISFFRQGYLVGFNNHYSSTGIYISTSIVYYFYRILCAEKKKRTNVIFLILSILTLMMTGKRAVFIFSIFACSFIYFIVNNNFKSFFKYFLLCTLIILIIFIVSKFVPSVNNTILRFVENEGDQSFSGRTVLYEKAIELFKRNPIIGNGWLSFRNYFSYNARYYSMANVSFDTHNIYLQLLCETGILGLLFFGAVMFSSLFETLKLLYNKKFKENVEYYNMLVFSAIYQVYFLTYGITGNPLYDPQCYTLYFISIAITILCIYKSKSVKEVEKNEKNLYNYIS